MYPNISCDLSFQNVNASTDSKYSTCWGDVKGSRRVRRVSSPCKFFFCFLTNDFFYLTFVDCLEKTHESVREGRRSRQGLGKETAEARDPSAS